MIVMEKASPRNRHLLFKNRDGCWTWERIKNQQTEPSANSQNSHFDFDTWAVQVKRQMIAALNRRGVR